METSAEQRSRIKKLQHRVQDAPDTLTLEEFRQLLEAKGVNRLYAIKALRSVFKCRLRDAKTVTDLLTGLIEIRWTQGVGLGSIGFAHYVDPPTEPRYP